MPYEPLHHKYRPQTFGELVGQGAIAQTLTHAIEGDRIAPAYLFTGPRGTGKTSSARILAKSLNCLTAGKPTATPCGHCQTCQEITRGIAMDIIEIDAASNTGVDNIREIIERAQFAPVQCRYKVYAIDECLTGDSLVLTDQGLLRIDNPEIKGKKVLSYNDSSKEWEFKKVVRWLDQGEKPTLVIKTTHREIQCTSNHLVRTEQGWIPAKDVKEGMKILSPVNVDAALPFTNTAWMDVSEDLLVDISLKATTTGQNHTIWNLFSNKLNHFNHFAHVDAEKSLKFQNFYKEKAVESSAFNRIGKDIPIKKVMGYGNSEQIITLPILPTCSQSHWDSSMGHYWEIVPSDILTKIVDFQDSLGHTQIVNVIGQNIKLHVFQNCVQSYELRQIKDMATSQLLVAHVAIPSLEKCLTSLNQLDAENLYRWNGLTKSPPKVLLGGFLTMDHLVSVQKEVLKFNYIPKDSQHQKINSLPHGLPTSDTLYQQSFIPEKVRVNNTATYRWERVPVENGWQTSSNIPYQQWTTNLEMVESVCLDGVEQVYDIEVEDNHNFVANGLLVHNCHMLSVAAFNALLKTLEEPPPRVVFILATTDPQRVLNTIISRCQRFDFRRIPLDAMVGHLGQIAQTEGIAIAPDALTLVAQIANGGLRDAESLLDQLSLTDGEICSENVWDLVGAVPEKDLLTLIEAIRSGDPEAILSQCRHLLDRGREPLILLQNLTTFYLNLLIAKTAPQRNDLIAVTAPTWEALKAEAHHWQTATILQSQQALKTSEIQIRQSTQPRLWLEVALLGLLPAALTAAIPQTPQAQPAPLRSEPSPSTTRTPPQTFAPTPPASSHPDPPPKTFTIPQPPTANPQTSPPLPTSHSPLPASPDPDTIVQQRIQAIWQRVVDTIQPPSTQMLVRQQCTLIDCDLDDGWAHIGVPSKGFLKMAETKVPQITAAFQQVLDAHITLELKIRSETQTPARSQPRPAPQSFAPQSPPPQPQTPPQPKTPPPNSHSPLPTSPTPQPEEEPEPAAVAPQQSLAASELDQLAQQLAKAFDGDVIDFL